MPVQRVSRNSEFVLSFSLLIFFLGSVIASILLGRYHFHHDAFKTISRESIYFIKTCMELDYTQRASAYDLLSHPWLRNEFEYYLIQQQESNNSLNRSDSNMSRRFLSFPLITSNGAKTLIDSTARHFTNPTKTGMRDTSMLAVAFSMPVSQIKQIRSLFQAIDRNGNGLIGTYISSSAISSLVLH